MYSSCETDKLHDALCGKNEKCMVHRAIFVKKCIIERALFENHG